MMKLDKILMLSIIIMSVFSVIAEDRHALHIEPFHFTVTDRVKREPYAYNYANMRAPAIYAKDYNQQYDTVKTVEMEKLDKTDKFDQAKAYEITVQDETAKFDNVKTIEIKAADRTSSFDYVKTPVVMIQRKEAKTDKVMWFNIGLDQFEYVSQLRELMSQARMYHNQNDFAKEKEMSDAFSSLLQIIDTETNKVDEVVETSNN